MAKRKTHEEFVEEMKIVNPNIEILGKYKNSYTKIDCLCKVCNYKWAVTPSHLLHGTGCPKCNKRAIRSHEEFIDEMKTINKDIEIIGKYTTARNKVDCRCKICGHEWSPFANSLLQGYNCPKCSIASRTMTHEEFVNRMNKKYPNIEVISKYTIMKNRVTLKCKIHNVVWDRYPQDILNNGKGCRYCDNRMYEKNFLESQDYFEEIIHDINHNISVMEKFKKIDDKILCKCNICNNDFNINIGSVLSRKKLSCPFCSDGISYPNKFIRAFLKQLPVYNLDYEWKLDGYKQYSYDNYFIYNSKEYVVEADGAQHYQKNKFGKWKPDKVQERDRIKDELATNHNIKMIRIDCQKSEANYIKEKILCSELSSIFDLSNIDWDLCNREALNSLVKQVCDLYKDGYRNIDIVNELQLDRHTVTKYLKIGSELGWCNYTPKQYKKVS